MIETKPQPMERTLRMAARPATRPSTERAASALPRTKTQPEPEAAPSSAKSERTARARRVSTADARLSRSEARLLTMAISCTVIVCALLVVYLAAYAHVTMLGMGQAKLRTELRQKRLENEKLKAALAVSLNPDLVAKNAAELGMTRDHRRVDYIAAPPTEDGAKLSQTPVDINSFGSPATKTGGEAGLQVANSGPTADQEQPNLNN